MNLGEPARRSGDGRLVVCATPIGNLEDVTLRMLRVLEEADAIACEDTRVTRKLLTRHGIAAGKLLSYHEHNERERAGALVKRVKRGELVALVTDAGMPGVSDPGRIVIDACREAGLEVDVLPGPSAATTALVASGEPAEHWEFTGFLPRKKGELRTLFERSGATLVAFESPRRLAASLALLAEVDSTRPVAVCRELTKLHEEVVRGAAANLAVRFSEGVRGEVTLVIGAADRQAAELGTARDAVEQLVAAGAKRRTAAAVVSSLTGVAANRLYGNGGG